jgi:hypothetical protein
MSQLFLNHFNLCTKKMQNPFLLNLVFLFFNRKDEEAAKFFILNLTLFIPLIALSVQQSRIEFSILLCTLCVFAVFLFLYSKDAEAAEVLIKGLLLTVLVVLYLSFQRIDLSILLCALCAFAVFTSSPKLILTH